MRLRDDQIAALRDGTEGVTPGPWRRFSKSPHVARDTARPDLHPNVGSVLVAECGNYRDKELVPFNMERWLADAAHIARCDPDTIRAITTEVLESRALLENAHIGVAVSAHNAALVAKDARIAELEASVDRYHALLTTSQKLMLSAQELRDGAFDVVTVDRAALGRDAT